MSITQHCFLQSNVSESEVARSNQHIFKSLNSKGNQERQDLTVVPFNQIDQPQMTQSMVQLINILNSNVTKPVTANFKEPLQTAALVSSFEIIRPMRIKIKESVSNNFTDQLNTSQNEFTPLKAAKSGKLQRKS